MWRLGKRQRIWLIGLRSDCWRIAKLRRAKSICLFSLRRRGIINFQQRRVCCTGNWVCPIAARLDINLGCTAFPYGLSVVHGMISAGLARKALLLNAEAITTVIHPQDRGLIPLHGDGAAATLVEPCEKRGIRGFLLGTLGEGYQHLMIPASGCAALARRRRKRKSPMNRALCRTAEHLHMNGPAIFHFSVYKVPEVIRQALDKMQLTIDDVDLVLLHQANKTMVDLIYKTLKVPEEKRFYFMENVGNTSGASSPMLLAEAWRQGRVKPGSRTLVAAFGVGLSWGVVVIDWPEDLGPAVQASVESEGKVPEPAKQPAAAAAS